MFHDFRHALRVLRKNPGFTFTALITLSLAIGANSTIFTLANALIFASMPVPALTGCWCWLRYAPA